MNHLLYPIKFYPTLKDKIWGGEKLKTLFDKNASTSTTGESWEISDVENNVSIVANGKLKGQSLKQILETYKEHLIGEKNYQVFGNKFPLLIKFIDAKQDLSIQLHPNDELAKKRHDCFGKTEMWYVMQADDTANLIVGFNQKVNKEKYLKHLEAKTLTEILNFDKVQPGDTYFIEVGRIHAIGAGVLLAEIQQTCDITYRIYDWDRLDLQGNSRELHNDLAIDAIDFDMEDNFRIDYSKVKNTSNQMVSCPYFTTNFIHLTETLEKENDKNSFIIYMCVEGEIEIIVNNISEILKCGETVLIPAIVKNFTINSNNAKLLEVFV